MDLSSNCKLSTENSGIPPSIVSLPARLQKKIQKKTDNELAQQNTEGRFSLKKSLNEEKYEKFNAAAAAAARNSKKFEEEGQQNPHKTVCKTGANSQFLQKNITTMKGGFSPVPKILTKEKNQYCVKDSFNPRNCYKEPPLWLKNSEILEKSDFWRKQFEILSDLHEKYFNLINNDESLIENWRIIMDYRTKMMDIFISILDNNLKFCCKENVEMYFWKVLYYNLIERLRRLQKHQQEYQNENKKFQTIKDIKLKALQLITDGIQFYDNRLECLNEKYIRKTLTPPSSTSTSTSNNSSYNQKYELLGKILIQKFLIHLGDLFRYKEQIENGNNFLTAKKYYEKAQKLIPTNGIPYNQLAILSVYNKKTFDAIYYYVRSLCASNPIQSAKESLKELFEEIRKKHDEQQQNLSRQKIKYIQKDTNLSFTANNIYDSQEYFNANTNTNLSSSSSSGGNTSNVNDLKLPLKKEIWIHPNGSKRLHRFGSIKMKQLYCFEENFLMKINSDDLQKSFMANYLLVLGKLFTGIGMENFTKILHEMLAEFKLIVHRNQFQLINEKRLLQIIALNIFVIEYNLKKEQQNSIDNVKNKEENDSKEIAVCNHALNTGLLIFGCILKRLNEILKSSFIEDSASGSNNHMSEDNVSQSQLIVLKMSTASLKNDKEILKNDLLKKKKFTYNDVPKNAKILLQATKIWCDWLKKNIKIWNPPKLSLENYNFLNDYDINPWNGLAQLVTLLSCVTFENDKNEFSSTKLVSLNNIAILNDDKLPEDEYFNGFLPLNLTYNTIKKSASLDAITTTTLKSHENHRTKSDIDVVDEEEYVNWEMIKRLKQIQKFGLETLCECQPPVFEKVCDGKGSVVYIKNVIKEDLIENDELESFENVDDDILDLIDDKDEDKSNKILSTATTATNTTTTTSTTTTTTISNDIANDDNHLLKKIPTNKNFKNLYENNSKSFESDQLTKTNNDVDVFKLIKRKQELEMKTKQHEIYEKKLENLLEHSGIMFHIEVRPKYLIPDTNCFIDFLNLIKIISLNSKHYQLTVPTVVCNELEGLSKGFKLSSLKTLQATSSTIRHFDEVTIRAREALDFIKSKDIKKSQIKYVTTKGSILNTSNFILEENDDYYYYYSANTKNNGNNNNWYNMNNCSTSSGSSSNNTNIGINIDANNRYEYSTNSNDDRILQTAINLCNRTNIEKKLKGKIFIQTEVVLFTTDRNLRVKALSRNLSVSQLKEFVTWSKIICERDLI